MRGAPLIRREYHPPQFPRLRPACLPHLSPLDNFEICSSHKRLQLLYSDSNGRCDTCRYKKEAQGAAH